jgi:hypothetical protein
MSDREYDLFEKASDETVIWQCSVQGALAAEEKISLLSLLTDREVFAICMATNEVMAGANAKHA